MTQESEIVLRNERTDFRVFVYRGSEAVGTIEASVSATTNELISLAFTDAISARTTYLGEWEGGRSESQ